MDADRKVGEAIGSQAMALEVHEAFTGEILQWWHARDRSRRYVRTKWTATETAVPLLQPTVFQPQGYAAFL